MIKLLVVDDDASMRRMLALLLAAPNLQLEMASNGEEALALAERFDPDVVLLDIELAGMSGLDVCRALRAHARPAVAGAGIILMSGQYGYGPADAAGPVGADRLIGKPFKVQELRTLVRKVHDQVVQRRQRS
jgi:two-component system, OmpR family, response regulator MprA